MARLVQAGEATAARRRVYFLLVATDGITPALSESGGQPQVSVNGGAWTDAGIGVLVAIGQGRYYADLDPATVATPGDWAETRFKSAGTAECPGDSVQVDYLPAEVAGRPSGLMGMLRRIFEWGSNYQDRDRATGAVRLRNHGNTATLQTQTQSTSGTVDSQTEGT